MPTFRQKVLKPGRYHVGGGKFRTLTADDLAKYVAGTQSLLDAGHAVSVQFEHADPGSEEGAPCQFSSERDRKAAQVKNGTGWLKGVKLGTDGAIDYSLSISDPVAAAKLKDGSIRFTSPELRREWTDGFGRKFQNVISHVALTHKPRDAGQSALIEALDDEAAVLQFSLDDFVQFADDGEDDDEKKKKFPPGDGDGDGKAGEGTGAEEVADPTAGKSEEPGNPDSPADEGAAKGRSQRIEAIMAHFEKKGLAMPADTKDVDIDKFLDRLLTALMTSNKVEEQAEVDKAAEEPDDDDDAGPVVEANTSPMQFSLADAESDRLSNKILAENIRLKHGQVIAKLGGLVRAGKITPALRDGLINRNSILQFSADGGERPSFTLAELASILEQNTVATIKLGLKPGEADQYSVAEHPDGDEFFKRGPNQPLNEAEATAVVDRMYRKRNLAAASK